MEHAHETCDLCSCTLVVVAGLRVLRDDVLNVTFT